MSIVSTSKFVAALAIGGAVVMAAIAPAQASHFEDDGYRNEVVVLKRSVAHTDDDFDDEDHDTRRSVVVKKRVFDEDDHFDRPERVIVKREVVQPVTVVRRVVQPVKVVIRERVVQPVTVVKRIVQPVKVVTKRIVHSDYGFHGHRRANHRYGLRSDF